MRTICLIEDRKKGTLSAPDLSGSVECALAEKGKQMSYSIRIADTTREERERIVAESIGNISGLCDGCSPGLIEMYRDYIDGKKELREINAEFRAGYTSGAQGPERGSCGRGE